MAEDNWDLSPSDYEQYDDDIFDQDSIEEDSSSSKYDDLSDEDVLSEDNEEEEDENERENYSQTENNIENRIEGDFDRLVGSIRASNDVASAIILSKAWDESDTGVLRGSRSENALIGDDDEDMEDEELTFMNDLRAASGIGKIKKSTKSKGKGKAKTRTPKQDPPLHPSVKSLLGDGNSAYIDGNLSAAIKTMEEVIRIEPRAGSAWGVLAASYRDLAMMCDEDEEEGRRRKSELKEKALKVSVMGAHLRHDPEEWWRLGGESREMGYTQQALYCYSKTNSLDPTNLGAWWDRATLAQEVGNLRVARRALLTILSYTAHDLGVLETLRPILIEENELDLCMQLYQDAFDHYRELYPLGHFQPQLPNSNSEFNVSSENPFTLYHILILSDLCTALSKPLLAINVIRQGVRWLQGRGYDGSYWDLLEDDREFDIAGSARNGFGEDGEMRQGFYNLDINARSRLAVARIKLGDLAEGNRHAKIVLDQPIIDYAPLFLEIADAYFDKDMYAEASRIYENLGADAGTSSMYILLQAAACRRNLGDLREAAEVYEHIILTDHNNTDAKMKLAEIYEVLNEPRKALELVYQVIDARKRRNAESQLNDTANQSSVLDANDVPTGTASSLFTEKRKSSKQSDAKKLKLTKAQAKEIEKKKEEETLRGWKRVKELWSSVERVWMKGKKLKGEDGSIDVEEENEQTEQAVKEWLLEAEKLVEGFRETRMLFTTSSSNSYNKRAQANQRNKKLTNIGAEEEMNSMASRLQLNMAQDSLHPKSKQAELNANATAFRGIAFSDWLELFLQYSFFLTQRDQYDLALEVLRHVLMSYVFQSQEKQDCLRLAIVTCAIYSKKPSVVVEQCRKLVLNHQFNNEPLRIIMASLASGLAATDEFISSTLQKHFLREMRIWHAAVKGKDMTWSTVTRRWTLTVGDSWKDGKSNPEKAKEKGKEKEKRNSAMDIDDVEGELDDEDDIQEEEEEEGVDVLKEKASDIIPRPKKESAVLPLIYGQMCAAAKSYQSALFYLLHAYDYQPNDPLICLSLTVASLGRAMQRQADNRNYLIVQAMGFLTKYRKFRLAQSALKEDEIEYNYGRAFHQLSLYSHAVTHYERALSIVEKRLKNEEDRDNVTSEKMGIAKEAAYNLSLIYVTTGATGLAEQLYRRWLSL